jgi:transposase
VRIVYPLKKQIEDGKLSIDQLIALHVDVCNQLAELSKQNSKLVEFTQQLKQRLDTLEPKNDDDDPPGPSPSEPYSLSAEDRRRREKLLNKLRNKRGQNRSSRRGRIATSDKIALASRTEDVYPSDVERQACKLSHTRVVWRLENNSAVLVAYRVWRYGRKFGKVVGTVGRCEYGLEFVLAIAYQVYVVGLSLDKVSLLTEFFQKIKLRKSQIDALLNRLAKFLESQFDTLCHLLACSAIVHADETSWSIKSVWTLVSEKARLLIFGVNKDAETLKKLIDPETFSGLVNSDHAAVYSRFSKTQKCWAHLIRKAIKLCLQDPKNKKFIRLRDELIAVFRLAVSLKADKRFSDDGRHNKVVELEDRLIDFVVADCQRYDDQQIGLMNDYRLLVKEIFQLASDHELFTFVTTANVVRPNGSVMQAEPTNNEAERTLRGPAISRKTGRTNKTSSGARRQTVIVSVLESLKYYLTRYSLSDIVAEVLKWQADGISCFQNQLNTMPGQPQRAQPPPRNCGSPILERLIPSV